MRTSGTLLFVILFTSTALADREVWFSEKMGCGRASAFAKSGKAEDLPGCTGKLPKEAPQIETFLGEAKRRLVDAEEALEKGKLDKIDPLLAAVEADLKHPPTINPELPDRWEQAQALYQGEITSLRNRRRLAPHLDKLKAAYGAAVEAGAKNRADVEGGPAEALKTSQACTAAFEEAKKSSVDFTTEVELGKERKRLDASAAECAQIRKTAEPLAKAQEKAAAKAAAKAAKEAAREEKARARMMKKTAAKKKK
jgi:hypothetical protein